MAELELHARFGGHDRARTQHRAGGKLLAEFADDHFMTCYGEVSPELFELVEAMREAGHVRVTWFEFFQGLESPVHA